MPHVRQIGHRSAIVVSFLIVQIAADMPISLFEQTPCRDGKDIAMPAIQDAPPSAAAVVVGLNKKDVE